MDDHQFDNLTKRLAMGGSRRSVLKALVGAAGGGVLALFAGRESGAGAGPLHRGQKCSLATAPCGLCLSCIAGRCAVNDVDTRCTGTDCGVCRHGVCRADRTRCADCEQCTRSLTCKSRCDAGDVCCDGRCRERGECCSTEDDCGPCEDCHNGRCAALPHLENRECGDCKRCRRGTCSVADPELLCDGICCVDDQVCIGVIDEECCPVASVCKNVLGQPVDCCRGQTVCTTEDGCCPVGPRACGPTTGGVFGEGQFRECCDASELCVGDKCCPTKRACTSVCCPEGQICGDRANNLCCAPCVNDQCCPVGKSCIDDGLGGGDNFCCDASVNTPCGDNGNGSFRDCCSGANEECCNGACVAACAEGLTLNPTTCQCECPPDAGFTAAATTLCCPFSPPCGSGDGARCCAQDEECCAGICKDTCEECLPHLVCGDVCCVHGEWCTDEGCCPWDRSCQPGGGPGSICCDGANLCLGVTPPTCCALGQEFCNGSQGQCCPAGLVCEGSCVDELGEGAGCCIEPGSAPIPYTCENLGCSAAVPGRTG